MVSFMFQQVKCIKNILLNYLLSITIEHKSNIFGANSFFCLMRKFCTLSLNSLIWLTYVFLSILLRWYNMIMVYFCVCIFSKNLPNKNNNKKHQKKDAICSTYACYVFLIILLEILSVYNLWK